MQAITCPETEHGRKDVALPAGSVGAVIYIGGEPGNPTSYLVEFQLNEIGDYVLESVPPEFLEPEHGWSE
jgi:hypothetical protein